MTRAHIGWLCLALALHGHAGEIDAWILSGQSNAEGYGMSGSPVVGGLAPAMTLADIGRTDLQAAHASVRFFQGDNDYNAIATSFGMTLPPRNSWHSMTSCEGLAFDWGTGRSNESGQRFGPELAFCDTMQRQLGLDIAVIKYARGSASLASSSTQLSNGTWNDFDPSDSRTNQYDQLLDTVREAVAALPGGDVLRLQGILWMQGESDATPTYAASYEANLSELIAALRLDLAAIAAASGGTLVPATSWNKLDVFVGTIAVPTSDGATVRAAQAAVTAADPDVYAVNGYSGLTLMTFDDWAGNGIHYDSAGQVRLGERFAATAAEGYHDGSDADDDGMPDSWEAGYFGSTNELPEGNHDGDGHSNYEEYIAGTDPTNPATFSVNIADTANRSIALQWSSVSQRQYSVYWAPTMTNTFAIQQSELDYPQNTYTDAIHAASAGGFYKLGVAMAETPTTQSHVPEGYSLSWADEFDGPSLDTNNWIVGNLRDPVSGDLVPGAAGDHLLNSGYAGYVTAEDSYIVNGHLVLRNQKRTYAGSNPAGSYAYTSGWIMSMHRVYLNKGYVEVRARFPSGDKVWPAIWLIAEDLFWGPEWDLWEYFGYRSDVGHDNMGIHLCYDVWPNQKWSSAWISGYDANFDCESLHTYGFEWTDTFARWTIDGVQVRYLANTFGASWPNEDMYIVLNNGAKTASPDTATSWPNTLSIDYVRLYQK